jgi:small subunit ribosomal protein S4e
MYLTRAKANKNLPIPRKGTKYIAKAASHSTDGVPVVIAVRDILGLAKTAKEVKEMTKENLIKINGKPVKDIKEGVRLFNVLEAGNKYRLNILKTGRFILEEVKGGERESRLCKVTGKTMLPEKVTQLNLHDGSNVISKEKVNVGDSVELDMSGKIKKVIAFEKGKNVLIVSGRSVGMKGKIDSVSNGKVKVKLEDKEDKVVELEKDHVVVGQ